MKKYWPFFTLLLGALMLVIQTGIKEYTVYCQVLGLCLCMFSLYKFSKRLPNKKKEESENFKF